MIRYELKGDIDALALPAPRESQREHELWLHSCFEAFVSDGSANGYIELNAAPSTEWAAYRFASYRGEMAVADDVEARQFSEYRSTGSIHLFRLRWSWRMFQFAVRWHVPLPIAGRLNLATVLEDVTGGKSYWAAAHPASGPPDFHNPDCFVIELPPPTRA